MTAEQAGFCSGKGCLTRSIVYLASLTALAGNLPAPDANLSLRRNGAGVTP
jgi:hypothetical protein